MAAITAAAVAQLREKTGAGMMECKKALTEADGDLDAAVTVLRKRLGNKVENRQDRSATEGLVMAFVRDDKRAGALLELNSETDFVARNDAFKELGQTLVRKLAAYTPESFPASLEALQADTMDDGKTVAETIIEAAGRIGEKVAIGRFAQFVAPDNGAVAAYIHNPGGSGADGGKVGVLVEAGGAATDVLAEIAREIALHISAASPRFLHESEIDEAVIAKEREIAEAQAASDPKMVGKPANVIASMVEGRLRKFKEETVLLNQSYVRDDKKTISALLKETPGANIVRFARFKVGEVAAPAADTNTAAPAENAPVSAS